MLGVWGKRSGDGCLSGDECLGREEWRWVSGEGVEMGA